MTARIGISVSKRKRDKRNVKETAMPNIPKRCNERREEIEDIRDALFGNPEKGIRSIVDVIFGNGRKGLVERISALEIQMKILIGINTAILLALIGLFIKN